MTVQSTSEIAVIAYGGEELTLGTWMLMTLKAERDMDCDASNDVRDTTERHAFRVRDRAQLSAILAEALLRNDWISMTGDTEGDHGSVFIIGPSTGLGPIILAAEPC